MHSRVRKQCQAFFFRLLDPSLSGIALTQSAPAGSCRDRGAGTPGACGRPAGGKRRRARRHRLIRISHTTNGIARSLSADRAEWCR